MDPQENPAEAALEVLVERLHARGRLRVWSLVVTVFGDAIVPRGGRAGLSLIRDLLARLGIEPGAVRTAMSRLAADRWVTRERDGRNAYYRLAEEGRHAFDLATRRIYAAGPPEWGGRWLVVVRVGAAENGGLPEEESAPPARFVPLGPGAWIGPLLAAEDGASARSGFPPGLLAIEGMATAMPDDIARLWDLAPVAAACESFLAGFAGLSRALAAGARLAPLDAMAARTLLIHDWRRIVLRDPGLPAALLPADWPGEEARALARDVYAALGAASEAWLDGAGLQGRGRGERFGGA